MIRLGLKHFAAVFRLYYVRYIQDFFFFFFFFDPLADVFKSD